MSLPTYAQVGGEVKQQERVNYLNKLSRVSRDQGKRDSSLYYGNKAKVLAEKIHFRKGQIDSYLNLGVTHREMEHFQQASHYLHRLLKICETERDEAGKGNAYDNLGHLAKAQGNDTLALKNHLLSLAIRKRIRDNYAIGNSYDNIGYIYAGRNDYPNAACYFDSSLVVFSKIKDDSRIALAAANAATQYYQLANNKVALNHFYTALKAYRKTKNPRGEIWIYNNIGQIYCDNGDYTRSLENFRKGLEINKKLNEWWQTVDSYTMIGRAYMVMKKYSEAMGYFRKALKLSRENKEPVREMIARYFIADTYRSMGQRDKALEEFMAAYHSAMEQNQRQWMGAASERTGRVYTEKKNFKEAKKWLLISQELNQGMSTERVLYQTHELLALVNQELGLYKEAYEHYKLFVKHRDQVEKNNASKLAMQHEFKRKEAASKAEQLKKDAQASKEIRDKGFQRNVAIIALVLMSFLVISLLYLFRLRSKKLEAERLNVELKRREVEAVKETERFKSRFLANISHEFRTPLTLINGHLELLKQQAGGNELSRYIEMENNGKRLLQLINQLLDLSKMESGQYKLRFREGNIVTEIQAHVQAFLSLAEQTGIHLQMDTSGVNPEVQKQPFGFSSEAVGIMIGNLLSNAMKFTPAAGKVCVKIGFSGSQISVSVSDTGRGIPHEQLERVFDRFYQVEEQEGRLQSGSGIGLALVKELATMHGGNVSVKNSDEGGCVFTLLLSSMEVNETEKTVPEEAAGKQVLASESGNEINISPEDAENLPLVLVVEDQTQLRKFICESLGPNYRFLEAVHGLEGVEMATNHLPDLIISDVMMPEMDGVTLVSRLKSDEATSHIPVILLTAKADQESKETGLETGANDYLVKPFSVVELKLRVRNLLYLRERLREKLSKGNIPSKEEVPELGERDREFLQKLVSVVENNLSNPQFGVNPLSESMFLSSSQLTRKLKSLTGETPADFIRQIRLQKALALLRSGMSIADVAWNVGFEDPSYFGKVFKKQFGVPPSEMEKLEL